MKKIITLLTITLTFSSFAQISLEHTYNTSSGFYLVELSNSGFKYVIEDVINKEIRLYHTNHSLWKTISLNIPSQNRIVSISYISEELFNTNNSNIEFILNLYDSNTNDWNRRIIDENNNIILNLQDKSPSVFKIPSNDFKMEVQDFTNDRTEIYDLPGTIPTTSLAQQLSDNTAVLANPYPNPSLNQIKLPYSLPTGTNQAKLKIYNTSGQLIETLIIDHAFDHILLDITSYQQGSYIYKIEANGTVSNTKTFIKTN